MPCGKTQFMRAHARGGKLGFRVRVILWDEGCALW